MMSTFTNPNHDNQLRSFVAARLLPLFALLLFTSASITAATPDDCQTLRGHGKRAEAKQCFAGLVRNSDPAVRAEGYWGLARYKEANDQFRAAGRVHKDSAPLRVRWGLFFLERFNREDASKLFQEALTLDKNNAAAYLGLARTAAEGFESRAEEFARKAISLNPQFVEAQELLAYLALEDNDPQRASSEAQKALQMSPQALDALSVLATIDWMADKSQSAWADRIWKINPVYGTAYATAGHFFVINRRYEEGVKCYRKALELDPDLWEARSQLGINLMRLGMDTEAKEQLERCYNAEYKNSETVNSLLLLDKYQDYETFRTPTTILRLHKSEAALLRTYMEPELQRAINTYQKKYRMKLPGPVRVEVYPNHDDFAVRTMGLPGLGLLGVTFGTVIAMDSPSGRPPGEFHWASTLWHELNHAYVLTATQHRVPRWFGEGLAVHEETETSRDWGDRLSPEVIMALQQKKLLPLLELDRGFVRPRYPDQVGVSYYQAGKICDYIAQKWGEESLLGIMRSFAERKTTAEAIQQNLQQTPENFDRGFFNWLDAQTKTTVEHFTEWRQRARKVAALEKQGKHDDAIREGLAIRDWYPEYVESGSVYELLARAYKAKGDNKSAALQLERYRDIGGRNPETLKALAALQKDLGNPKSAADTLSRLNYIYPQDAEMHQQLGGFLLETGDGKNAVREFRAVLAGKPPDPAASHYQLALALHKTGQSEKAKDQVLQALEIAPNFKPAQKLLLELTH